MLLAAALVGAASSPKKEDSEAALEAADGFELQAESFIREKIMSETCWCEGKIIS